MSSPYSAPPSSPLPPAPGAPVGPSLIWLRLVGVVVATFALIIIVATQLPPSVIAARNLAYPKPSISISTDGPTTVVLGNAIQFSATIHSGRELTFRWDFGDDSTGAGAQASHTYQDYGNYDVTVTARDGIGQVARAQTSVSVVPLPPHAAFTYQAESYYTYCIDFDASSSTGTNLSYSWDFGDGYSSSSEAPTDCYYNTGTYNVTLTVTDAVGQTSSTAQQVVISG